MPTFEKLIVALIGETDKPANYTMYINTYLFILDLQSCACVYVHIYGHYVIEGVGGWDQEEVSG